MNNQELLQKISLIEFVLHEIHSLENVSPKEIELAYKTSREVLKELDKKANV